MLMYYFFKTMLMLIVPLICECFFLLLMFLASLSLLFSSLIFFLSPLLYPLSISPFLPLFLFPYFPLLSFSSLSFFFISLIVFSFSFPPHYSLFFYFSPISYGLHFLTFSLSLSFLNWVVLLASDKRIGLSKSSSCE